MIHNFDFVGTEEELPNAKTASVKKLLKEKIK
jgi:hypothetical protein